MASSGEQGLSDKAVAIGGANSTLAIDDASAPTLGANGLPDQLPAGTTVVWRATFLHMGPGLASDLLVVDPATFPAAVDWRDSFSPGRSLGDVLDSLDAVGTDEVPVVLAGPYTDEFPDAGVIEMVPELVRYRVVGRIVTTPWQRVGADDAHDGERHCPAVAGGDRTRERSSGSGRRHRGRAR
ncbi:MAG: hypothetical protein R2715_12415 [Ilumatobacteraceae bacterium]